MGNPEAEVTDTVPKSPAPATLFQSSHDSFVLETMPNKSTQLLCAK